jgi:hypothetical protein
MTVKTYMVSITEDRGSSEKMTCVIISWCLVIVAFHFEVSSGSFTAASFP